MENIIDRLKKIQELARRGEKHEAAVAKKMLEGQLAKYNLTLADINENTRKKRSFKSSNNTQAVLFLCVMTIVGGKRISEMYYIRSKPNVNYIDVTDVEYFDILQLYEFHKRQFTKEAKANKKAFELAYQRKHNLFPTTDTEELSRNKWSDEEWLRIHLIINSLEDIQFRKQIEE